MKRRDRDIGRIVGNIGVRYHGSIVVDEGKATFKIVRASTYLPCKMKAALWKGG